VIPDLTGQIDPAPFEAPFWAALRARRLVIQRCLACGYRQHPPRPVCARCSAAALTFDPSPGRAVIFAATTVYRAPIPALRPRTPYCIALADLDEGVRLMANVTGVPPDAVRPGLPVVVGFAEITPEVTLPVFRPRPAPRSGDGRLSEDEATRGPA
jgi:uncharacterized OB-fold protein